MLTVHLKEGTAKRRLPTEPFVDHHRQSVLIAGYTRLAADLLGGHVERGAGGIPRRKRVQAPLHHGQAKVTEHHLSVTFKSRFSGLISRWITRCWWA